LNSFGKPKDQAPLLSPVGCQWKKYVKILRAGRQRNPLTAAQRAKKRPKQSKEQNLLDRLEGYEDCILAFLWEMDLPFTNNEAERAFRMLKVRAKSLDAFALWPAHVATLAFSAISQPYESNACQYSNTSASLSMAAPSYLRQHNEPE
jgi:hypothetical protein